MGSETYLHHCLLPPLFIDNFGGKTYLRRYPPPIVDHFVAVHRPLLLPVFKSPQPLLSIAAEQG